MPRNRIKPLGTRHYANYSKEKLQECLQAVKNGVLSQRVAAGRYGIPYSTLKNKLKGRHSRPVGRSKIFSEAEESSFVQHVIKLADLGFPMIERDFRFAVKMYLDKKGAQIQVFKENLPGYEWTKAFLARHPELSVRLSSNIKKVRATVGGPEISEYMDNLKVTLQGIPPARIWNYDETNLCDEPGQKKVICKRGTKYVENICNSTKSSTSIMFCGNAEGKLLAPYIVYKADHLWSTWMENGPAGARYNRTKSGWFDGQTFEDWFEKLFLPEVKKENQPSVIIGDNLSSHISSHVLKLCEEYQVRFVCLPPNTTHITQPLDVAFFAPMKRLWRAILTKWKESKSGSKHTSIPKDIFPSLLKELMSKLEGNQAQNLMSGFKKCGIYPCNKENLLARLPENLNEVDPDTVGDAFLEQLNVKRRDFLAIGGPIRKRKKVQVPAGKSFSIADINEAGPSGTRPTPRKAAKSRSQKQRINSSDSEDEDDPQDNIILESDSETHSDIEEGVDTSIERNETMNSPEFHSEKYAVGDHVIVLFNGQKYAGKVLEISEEGPKVTCMEKGFRFWRWPEREDSQIYDWEDILGKIQSPKQVSKRNQFSVSELDNFV